MNNFIFHEERLFKTKNIFHDIEGLEKQVTHRYKVRDDRDQNPISYEEWVEREGKAFLMWKAFKNRCVATVNMPEFQEVKHLLEGSCWDFRNDFPDFHFSLWEDEVEDVIFSVNPLSTTDKKYLGTIEQVVSIYGGLPRNGICIVNNASPEQLNKIFQLTAKSSSWISTDSTSGSGFFSPDETLWRMIFV